MKLRNLTLHNVRRFTDKTVTLGPFGDGLTTITEENERGKSTFFDALHALFFHDYGSGRKEIKELQPYSGGAIKIAAEIDLDGKAYRVEKLFNLKKPGSSASITDLATGIILKQADDAERWIEDNILHSSKGPVGLLWVRQGTVGVDAAKAEADGIDARRDVMSSVRGQIDAVTGGRRMDAILQRCRSELDTISTKNGKAKAGSQWKEAEDQAERLQLEQEKLQKSVAALSQDLEMKKKIANRLRALNDPELRNRRQQAITEGEASLAHARDHDKRIKEANKDLQLLLAESQKSDRIIKDIEALRQQRQELSRAIDEKQTALEAVKTAKANALQAMEKQQEIIKEKDEQRRALGDALANARKEERIREKQKRLDTLQTLFANLQEPLDQLKKAGLVLEKPTIDAEELSHLSDLERRRDIAQEKRKFHFSSFVLSSQGAKATSNGQDLPDGKPLHIDRPLDIALPGFGSMQLLPAQGAGQGIENPASLQQEIDHVLHTLGFASISAAKAAFEANRIAKSDRQVALTQIRAIAPDGVDALKREQDQLCAELGISIEKIPALSLGGDSKNMPTSEEIEKEIRILDETLDGLRATLPQLQERVNKASDVLTEEEVLLSERRNRLNELQPSSDEDKQFQSAKLAQATLSPQIAQMQTHVAQLRQQAPDLDAAEAAYKRAVMADEQDQKEIRLQEKDLARLNGAIETQSEGAVEEKLSEVTGKLSRAQARAEQFSNHAKAIRLLITHLEAARAEAQETYFEPIRKELLPLLRQLHSGADFQIDADRLLIDTITRNGVTDKVDVLSGGAYEQIAILTRLAFARLFAKRGSHVPIILDDALVHTDDERISTMFNMLAQIAKDQQIIVLSCRTRAFSDLGGERAFIREIDNS
nr:AAA family ATPase [uncultured Cohaesibacter sp.]